MPASWPAWVWPWIAGLAAVVTEYSYRLMPDAPYYRQWVGLALMVPISYGVFRIVTAAPSLLAGFVVFGVVTMGLRVLVTVAVLREAVSWYTWIALGLLIVAKGLIR